MVTKDQQERFLTVLRKVVREFYTDDPQKSNSYGRIINTRQFDRLKGILDACDPNSIVTGGATDREDLYIAPTIVKDVTNDSPLMKDELFGMFVSSILFLLILIFSHDDDFVGPILPVVPVKDMDEAIAIVNSRYVCILNAKKKDF